MKALVAGWFSFTDMGATAGDLLVRDLVGEWLDQAGVSYDVAHAEPFSDGVRWEEVSPTAYTHLVFTCGPIGNGPPVDELLGRFRGCQLIGVDLTMLEPLGDWNPFSLLLERDSDRMSRPDFALIAPASRVPVVGVVLIHKQPEYGERDAHVQANRAIEEVLSARECARLLIDTRLDVENQGGLRTSAEVVAMFSKADVVVTSRLHGLVLGLRAGVPVVAVDPVVGGAKVSRQAAALGWPHCFPADVDQATLNAAIDSCLDESTDEMVRQIVQRATRSLGEAKESFDKAFSAPPASGLS